jgi:hypothetical protein
VAVDHGQSGHLDLGLGILPGLVGGVCLARLFGAVGGALLAPGVGAAVVLLLGVAFLGAGRLGGLGGAAGRGGFLG